LYGIERVEDFPIVYFSREEVSAIRSRYSRHEVLTRYGLDAGKKYVALAGFFGRYKGFLTAIKALEFLPDDYQLALVGGEHPQAITADAEIGPYLRQILGFSLHEQAGGIHHEGTNPGDMMRAAGGASRAEMLEAELYRHTDLKYFLPRKPLGHRIHFLGQVSDEEMPLLYVSLDYFVHPYIKTQSGQSGSGPATLALEFGTRALFSNVGVFREMHHYFRGGMRFFNIGNFMELAQAIERYDQQAGSLPECRNASQQRYQPRDLVAKYVALLSALPSA
jgi:glycosyltransferase involved in cell wall biosynthesis